MPQKLPPDLLLKWVAEKGDQPYLHQPVDGVWKTYTWKQVDDQVRRVATALQGLGLARGDKVAIAGRNTAHWFMSDFASGAIGCVTVGLYPKQAPENVEYILDHSESKAVFVGPMPDIDQFMNAVPEGIKTIALPYPGVPECDYHWDELVADNEPMPEDDLVRLEEGELATLVYTSGTTGKPKGVMLTTQTMLFAMDGLLEVMPPRGEEIFFSYLPLAHIFERGVVELASIYLGAQVYFLEDLEKFAEQLAYVRPTRFAAVPLVWGRLQKGILEKVPQKKLDRLLRIPLLNNYIRKKILKGVGLDRARICLSGAAPLPVNTLEWFQTIGLEILQGYGSTENSAYVSVNLPGANRIGSVGKPLPGVELSFTDAGEILTRHKANMSGYYKQPDKTAETLTEDGWLHTGDKGHQDADGFLYVTGRVKDIFKTAKGKYVAPAPIEGAMSRNNDLDQMCLVGTNLNQPIMLATLTEEARKKPREEVEQGLLEDMEIVNRDLEEHDKIAKVVIVSDEWSVDNGLLTPTMKVKRNVVEDQYQDLIQAQGAKRDVRVAWE